MLLLFDVWQNTFSIDVVVIAVIVVVDVDVDVGCSGFCAPKNQNQRARSPHEERVCENSI